GFLLRRSRSIIVNLTQRRSTRCNVQAIDSKVVPSRAASSPVVRRFIKASHPSLQAWHCSSHPAHFSTPLRELSSAPELTRASGQGLRASTRPEPSDQRHRLLSSSPAAGVRQRRGCSRYYKDARARWTASPPPLAV